MNSKNKPSNDVEVVTLGGELTIARAAELKELLSESFQGSGSIQIRLEEVSAVDLSCLQLLCSAHRTASAMNRQLSLEGAIPTVFRQVIQHAGFARQKGCEFSTATNCLWSGGE